MKEEKPSHILNVKNEMKNFYFPEKYRFNIRGKNDLFEKKVFFTTVLTTEYKTFSFTYCGNTRYNLKYLFSIRLH